MLEYWAALSAEHKLHEDDSDGYECCKLIAGRLWHLVTDMRQFDAYTKKNPAVSVADAEKYLEARGINSRRDALLMDRIDVARLRAGDCVRTAAR